MGCGSGEGRDEIGVCGGDVWCGGGERGDEMEGRKGVGSEGRGEGEGGVE